MVKISNTRKRTNVALVLDESGSMESMRDAAIELFNTQVTTWREAAEYNHEVRLSLFTFGELKNGVREVLYNIAPDNMPLLTRDLYTPQAATPMRDGIGLAITRLSELDDGGDDTAFLVVVITDGYENASKEWSAKALNTRTSELTATGRWTFAAYGANISLTDLQETTGVSVSAGNYRQYTPTSAGVYALSVQAEEDVRGFSSLRSSGGTATISYASE